MRILVTNDDGIHATGIRALVERLSFEHEVYVIAPDSERSAAGHSLTLHTPIRVEEFDMDLDVTKAWAISGTPSDCVKIGVSQILDKKPDLIISGINHGPNLGSDILYSGTVSAAMEGAVLGYPSIAISLFNGDTGQANFVYAADFLVKFVNRVVDIKFPRKTILNINVPSVPTNDEAGVEVTRLGGRIYTDDYEKRVDPRGKDYYWLAGELIDKSEADGRDVQAVRNGKVSITPITFRMTNIDILQDLEDAFCDGSCALKYPE